MTHRSFNELIGELPQERQDEIMKHALEIRESMSPVECCGRDLHFYGCPALKPHDHAAYILPAKCTYMPSSTWFCYIHKMAVKGCSAMRDEMIKANYNSDDLCNDEKELCGKHLLEVTFCEDEGRKCIHCGYHAKPHEFDDESERAAIVFVCSKCRINNGLTI